MSKIKVHFQRFEFKYQLPEAIVEGMIPEFLKYMEWDPYAKDLPDNSYVVSSLYYDSAGLDCYYQKLAGDRTRKKIRIRYYDSKLLPETLVFLEIKRKYDTVVVKDRLILKLEDAYNLVEQNKRPKLDLTGHDQNTLNEFMWLKLYNGMMPQNLVIYKRKPMISRVDPNFRVTIDYDLHTCSSSWLQKECNELSVNPEMAVIEVKFNNILPFWFQNIIQRYNMQQQPFSKYCSSLEVCKPGLASAAIKIPDLKLAYGV